MESPADAALLRRMLGRRFAADGTTAYPKPPPAAQLSTTLPPSLLLQGLLRSRMAEPIFLVVSLQTGEWQNSPWDQAWPQLPSQNNTHITNNQICQYVYSQSGGGACTQLRSSRRLRAADPLQFACGRQGRSCRWDVGRVSWAVAVGRPSRVIGG